MLIVAAWRRAVLCALAAAVVSSPVSREHHNNSDNTCAEIIGRKFYYHKLQMSNVCDARTDILDTSSWDNDSSWIWEQAFFNDFASGMSLTEYEETTARKTGVGPYTVHYDGWGSMAVQTSGNAGTWQMLECDAVGVVTASQAVVGSSLIGVLGMRTDYKDYPGNEAYSGCHTNSSDIMCLFGPRGSELDPTATTLSENTSSKILPAPGAVNYFRIVRDQNAFFGFRFKFHYEFLVRVRTTREKEKYISPPGQSLGSKVIWNTYIAAKFAGSWAKYGNIDALRATMPLHINESPEPTKNACNSHAAAFILNYQSMSRNIPERTITNRELCEFHRTRYKGRNADLQDTDDVQALSDKYGDKGLKIWDEYMEINDVYDVNKYLDALYKGASLIANNKPYFYSYVNSKLGHAEVVLGHKYTEIEDVYYRVTIDSETGIDVRYLRTEYRIIEYKQIRMRNFSNDYSIREFLVYNCDISQEGASVVSIKEREDWINTRSSSRNNTLRNRGFLCGFSGVL